MWLAPILAAVAALTPPADGLALNPELPLSSCANGVQAITVRAGTNTTLEGRLEGTIEANVHVPNDSWCSGYLPLEPQHCLIVSAPVSVTLEVIDASGVDSVLVMQDESDALVTCDDDGGYNLLSRMDARLEPGAYRVSVGSYGPGHQAEYRMTVSAR